MTKKIKAAKTAQVKTDKVAPAKASSQPASKRVSAKGARPTPPQTVKGTVRENSKQAQLIEMLHQTSGTTIQKIMDVTGWQQHSVRGFLSGTIKKKLGLTIISDKTKDGFRTYRIKVA